MSMFPARTRLFDDLLNELGGFYVKPLHGDPLPQNIKVDIQEQNGLYSIQAELPGVKKDDIHVDIEGAVVSIKAEIKQQDQSTEGERSLRSERYYGSVSRSFELPQEIDLERAEASYDDGILKLILPKKAQGESSRKLAIK